MPINETIQEQAAKHALEKKLGRKVDVHELYSLGAYMDAADGTPPAAESNAAPAAAPTLPAPAKPMSKATKWVLALGLLFILGVIVLAVLVVVVADSPVIFADEPGSAAARYLEVESLGARGVTSRISTATVEWRRPVYFPQLISRWGAAPRGDHGALFRAQLGRLATLGEAWAEPEREMYATPAASFA